MSIQDEIFDVDAALEGRSEREAFNRIMNHYLGIEKQYERLSYLIREVQRGDGASKALSEWFR
jgi:hypothetical protein